ncbi:uncharacterized protein LOC110861278 [Folsomia candida]|uniref:Uncharacterized protein n=1 Tax=Folsomia candida TaxID=158441 RepID=A0A226D3Q0_FOLCA|nr:uncharacterized protein LOC110861278 [Folsomia candida]OXA39377.1 hypothetical protein Fcan01_25934 [Folsomia candida]
MALNNHNVSVKLHCYFIKKGKKRGPHSKTFNQDQTWTQVLKEFKLGAYNQPNKYQIMTRKKNISARLGDRISGILTNFKTKKKISVKLEEKMSSSGATDASGKSRAVQSASFRRGEVRIGGHGTRSESVAGGSNPDDDTNVPDAPEDSPDPLDAPDDIYDQQLNSVLSNPEDQTTAEEIKEKFITQLRQWADKDFLEMRMEWVQFKAKHVSIVRHLSGKIFTLLECGLGN